MIKLIFRFIYWLLGTAIFYFVVYYPESINQPLQWSPLWKSMLAMLVILIIGIYMGNKFKTE